MSPRGSHAGDAHGSDAARADATASVTGRTATSGDELARVVAACDAPVDARAGAEDWARSGAMAVTGFPDGPPLVAPAAFATAAARAVAEVARLARALGLPRAPGLDALDGALLLGERAAALALARRGDVAPGGGCRLLRTRDGAVALQLVRDDDAVLLDAWLETPRGGAEPWEFAARALRARDAEPVALRARELGLACAVAAAPRADAGAWLDTRELAPASENIAGRAAARGAARGHARAEGDATAHSTSRGPARGRRPLVVDLSSLWAGPLCTHLLALAGADVVKVESTRRPDGARRGPADFHDLLNAGKRSVALDFASADGRAALLRLVAAADIVVEASRPRALAQLGIDAERIVARGRGATWVSITGYGRDEPGASWIAYGDDAAVAAGASFALRARERARGAIDSPAAARADGLCFCGDALADPLTGARAAAAALAAHADGGGRLLSIPLTGVVASVLATAPIAADVGSARLEAAPPRLRPARGRAAALGADTRDVLGVLDARPC